MPQTITCDLLNFIAPSAYRLEGDKLTLELSTSEACLLHEALIVASQLPEASETAVLATESLAEFIRIAAQVAEGFDPDNDALAP